MRVSELSAQLASEEAALRTNLESAEYATVDVPSRAFGRPPEFPGTRRLSNRFDVLSWRFCDDELKVYLEGEDSVSRKATASELADLEVSVQYGTAACTAPFSIGLI